MMASFVGWLRAGRGTWAVDCGKLGVKGIFRSSFPLSLLPSFHLELLPVSILKVRD